MSLIITATAIETAVAVATGVANGIVAEIRRLTIRIDAEAAPPTDLDVTIDLGSIDLRRTEHAMATIVKPGLSTLLMSRVPREEIGMFMRMHHAPRAAKIRSKTEFPRTEKRRPTQGNYYRAPPFVTLC